LFLFDEVKKTYYETLGIEKSAGAAEIKKAYFGLVHKYQPDRFPEEFKEIRAAYETLMDGEKRAEYDAIGKLPSSVAPLFYEAQRLDRLGRLAKAAELYRIILKTHPELDAVREHYAVSLSDNGKTGGACEEWEELCRRHPDNPRYARELGESYLDRGWHKKAHAESRHALALDRSSIDGWNLLISCAIANLKNARVWDELDAITFEALEAVKEVKTDEWKKIPLNTHAFLACGINNIDGARIYARELIRLIREGGREGQDEGQRSLREILTLIPGNSLAALYPEFREMAGLFPNLHDNTILGQLDDIRLSFEIEGLIAKKFPEIFRDLFRILNSDSEAEGDEAEVAAIEYMLLDEKRIYEPLIRRLKAEFPELYELHRAFFNELLRARDVDRMMFQRSKKVKKFRRQLGSDAEEPASAQPEPVRRAQPKVGRNDPCPCGSGRKYKHCCGA
jgi:tetratricopeptide (TPR) repeat protein